MIHSNPRGIKPPTCPLPRAYEGWTSAAGCPGAAVGLPKALVYHPGPKALPLEL